MGRFCECEVVFHVLSGREVRVFLGMTQVMTDLDFEMKPKKGSEVQFKPPYQGLPKSTFHKRECTIACSLGLFRENFC